MSENQDLKSFLRNTEKALRSNTVEDLNQALCIILKNKENRIDEIKSVMLIVANYYGISIRFLKNSTARGKIKVAQKMAYCLLHYELGLTVRRIANKNVFDKYPNSVSIGILYYQRLNPKIKADADFLETYKLLQQKIKNENIK